MTNAFNRGSAPERARDEKLRPGSFKPGHEKKGGRKRGKPNAISSDYRMAILEAAYRIGFDGNGKDGITGYFMWFGRYHPKDFYIELYCRLLELEAQENYSVWSAEPISTGGLNKRTREWIERKEREKQPAHSTPVSPGDWTGQEFPLSGLMQLVTATRVLGGGYNEQTTSADWK